MTMTAERIKGMLDVALLKPTGTVSDVRTLARVVRDERFGFVSLPDNPLLLFLPLRVVTRRTQSTQCCLTSSISVRSISLVVLGLWIPGMTEGAKAGPWSSAGSLTAPAWVSSTDSFAP